MAAKIHRRHLQGFAAGVILTGLVYVLILLQSLWARPTQHQDEIEHQLFTVHEQLSEIASNNESGNVRGTVAALMLKLDGIRRLHKAVVEKSGVEGVELRERLAEAEARSAKLTHTVARLQGILRDQTESIAKLEKSESSSSPLHLPGGRRVNYTFFVVDNDHPSLWRNRQIRKSAAYGFIRYSAYRVSDKRIVVIGMGALVLRGRRRLEGCWWHQSDGKVLKGKISIDTLNEHHNYMYEPILLWCEFGEMVSRTGGYLKLKLDREITYPFREDGSEPIPSLEGPFTTNLAYCGPPIFRETVARAIPEFIDYHRYHAGYEHFYFYDVSTVNLAQVMGAVQPYIDAGLVTWEDAREAWQFDFYYYGQLMFMHDCMYRNRFTTKWVSFHDFDEYIEVPPPLTFPTILRQHEGKPYITNGMYSYDTQSCIIDDHEGDKSPEAFWSEKQERWAVERLLQRNNKTYCLDGEMDRKHCIDYYGHRKMVVCPQLVELVYTHKTERPQTGGADLSSDVWRHAHFRGLTRPAVACNKPEESAGWAREMAEYRGVAEIAAAARKCSREGFENKFLCFPQVK